MVSRRQGHNRLCIVKELLIFQSAPRPARTRLQQQRQDVPPSTAKFESAQSGRCVWQTIPKQGRTMTASLFSHSVGCTTTRNAKAQTTAAIAAKLTAGAKHWRQKKASQWLCMKAACLAIYKASENLRKVFARNKPPKE